MPDPRRDHLAVGDLSIAPGSAPERWEVRSRRADGAVDAPWGEWVRLARRIIDADALSRELEARGDAWDRGHAAAHSDDEAVNPYR